MNLEERAFVALAASEEAQAQTAVQIAKLDVLHGKLENLIKTLPDACGSQIRSAAMVCINSNMKESFRGVEVASGKLREELVETTLFTKKIRNILRFQGFWKIIQLVIAVAVIFGAGLGITSLAMRRNLDKLDELRSQIRVEQATLDKLQDETWGLELVQTKDGTKGIVLPKGVAVSYTGDYLGDKSGRQAIVLRP